MSELLPIILQNTYTSDDAYRRLGLLKQYFEAVTYRATSGEQPTLEAYFGGEEDVVDVRAVTAWMAAFPADMDRMFYERIEALGEAIEQTPKLVLYTPVKLSEDQQIELATEARVVVRAPVLLDFRVDPAAVGGCCFVWNGRYHDFSLARYMAGRENVVTAYFKQHV